MKKARALLFLFFLVFVGCANTCGGSQQQPTPQASQQEQPAQTASAEQPSPELAPARAPLSFRAMMRDASADGP